MRVSIRSFLRVFMTTWSIVGFISAFPATLPAADDATTTQLKAVIAGSLRSDSDKARDQYRHPLETLTWFGIKNDMTVVEIWPSGGWYTDILAPFLKEHGT